MRLLSIRPRLANKAAFVALLIFVLIFALLFGNFPFATPSLFAQGSIIYVNDNVIGENNGENWANAFTKLQNALDVAVAGDQIWVAAGIYYPGETTVTDNNIATATFQLETGVAIYGGFAGTEAELSQRDIAANLTLLSGDLQHDDTRDADNIMVINGNKNTNANHVVTANGVGTSARLDGFTITAGVALGDGSSCPSSCGGAIYSSGSNATLANLTIAGNRATFGAGILLLNPPPSPSTAPSSLESVTFTHNWSQGDGGGLQAQAGADITLTNVQFISNTTPGHGAGAFLNDVTAILTTVAFTDNVAAVPSGKGGGLANYTAADVTLEDVTFTNNRAYFGGAIYNEIGVSPTISGATFLDNSANFGGALYNSEDSTPQINQARFIGNSASSGGAAYNTQSNGATYKSVLFSGNFAIGGGGAMVNSNASPILMNVIFSGNRSTFAGAIYNYSSNPILSNVTLSANQVMTSGTAALHNINNSQLLLQNSIVWGNHIINGVPSNIVNDTGNATLIGNSLVEGGLPPLSTDQGHNLFTDPLFVREVDCGSDGLCADNPNTPADEGTDDDYGDLRLRAASPAIDVGDNAVVAEEPTDLAGNPRIVAIRALPATVDMGALERLNDAPVGHAGGPYTVDEGSALALNGSASTDEDGTIASYAWDCTNDGSNEVTSASPVGSSCTYPDDGTGTIKLTTTDNGGATNSTTAGVTILNVAPSFSAAPDQSTFVATAKSFNLGAFSDPGADSPWQVTVDWGDETANSQFDAATVGNLSAAHTYAAEGFFNVNITVSDGAGSSSDDFVAQVNAASVGIVTGKIVAGEEGVGNAEVKLTNELAAASSLSAVTLERTTTTAIDGSYTFDNVPPGEYTLFITPPEGYTLVGAAQQSITVVAGNTTVASNFTLQVDPGGGEGQLFMPNVQK